MNKKVVISILVVAIIIIAGVWYGQSLPEPATNQPVVDNSNSNLNTNTPISENGDNGEEPEVITSDIDTSDWLTYRNDLYSDEFFSFEFKYPKEWSVESIEPTVYPSVLLVSPMFEELRKKGGPIGSSASIKQQPNENNLSFLEYQDKYKSLTINTENIVDINFTEFEINGRKAIYYKTKYTMGMIDKNGNRTDDLIGIDSLSIAGDGYIVGISYHYEDVEWDEEIFETIKAIFNSIKLN